jgi:HEAT repeat protein
MTENTWEIGLESADPEQRRLAVAALSQSRVPGSPQLVIRALGDDDWRVRKEAIAAVIEIGPVSELLDALIATFSNSDNVGLRNAVSEALAGFGRPAIARISDEIGILDADGRKLAAEALGRTGHASAVTILNSLLQDPDANVRVAALEALGVAGAARLEEVAPLLCAAMRSGETLERLAALDAINALGIVVGWDELASAASEPVLERSVLVAGARTGAIDAAALLVQALGRQSAYREAWPVQALAEYIASSSEMTQAARRALGALEPEGREFLFRLTEVDESDTRAAALIVLATIGDEMSSRWVLDAVERDEPFGLAEQFIGAIGGLHPSVLKERLIQGASCQRALILRAFARVPNILPVELVLAEVANVIATDDDPVLSAALEVLASASDEKCFRLLVDRFTRVPATAHRNATVVLGEMSLRHREVARHLIDAYPHYGESWIPVTVLVSALGRGGGSLGASDMEILTQCLVSDLASVRCAALEALAEIGDVAAVDPIAFLLADEEQEVRLAAVRALGRMQDGGESTAIVGRLVDLAQRTDDRELLVVAVLAIGQTSDPRVLAVLRPLVKSPEPSVAVAAVEAAGLVNDPRRIDVLIDGLSHLDGDVVKTAMRMLAREGDVRVDAHLGACLDHDDWGVRRLAADLTGQRGGESASGLLRAKRATEREPLVQEALERALGVVEGTTPSRRSSTTPDQGSWRPR